MSIHHISLQDCLHNSHKSELLIELTILQAVLNNLNQKIMCMNASESEVLIYNTFSYSKLKECGFGSFLK